MGLLLKNVLFTVLVPGTVAVYAPLRIGSGRSTVSGPASLVAVLLLGIGTSIFVRCVWDFASAGRGTPAPMDAPKRLVVQGLYRHTRNPMYLGVLTTILGWAVLFGSRDLLVYAVLVATCFHLAVVLYEEPRLRRKFGDEYEAYRNRVPRWVPALRRRVD